MNEPNSTRAVYGENSTTGERRRVVSAPGGMWQVQQRDGSAGTRTYDPWHDVGQPAEWQRASVNAGVQ